jgi:di/tricarboxylate transporter
MRPPENSFGQLCREICPPDILVDLLCRNEEEIDGRRSFDLIETAAYAWSPTMSAAFTVLLVLGTTIVVFALDRLRVDIVAILSLLALVAIGAVDTVEALAGFSAPIVIMIGALFVVGEGLTRTGVAARVASLVAGLGRRHDRLLLPALMLLSAILSAVMSSTGTVAVMIPVAVGLARQLGKSPSALLMPMAFAAQLGGVLTLIGTPPNLVVSQALTEETGTGLSFFSLTPYGLVGLAAGILMMSWLGRWILPGGRDEGELSEDPSIRELADLFGLARRVVVCHVPGSSPFAGRTAAAVGARRRYSVSLLALVRPPAEPWARPRAIAVEPDTRIRRGDRLLVKGAPGSVEDFIEAGALEVQQSNPESLDERVILEVGLVEVLVNSQSRLIGRTVREVGFYRRYGVNVVGVRRRGVPLDQPVSSIRLDFGDSLLVVGDWERIERLRRDRRNLIVAATARAGAHQLPRAARAPLALGVLAIMLALMMFTSIPLVWPVVGGAVAMVLVGAVGVSSVYRAVQWPSLVMIAAMLPAATALENSGALDLIVGSLIGMLGTVPLAATVFGLMLLTSILSQVISNTATALLLAPVAVQMAGSLDIGATPLLICVAVAASTAFATPMASPVNALILGPGRYRFADFLKAGIALQLVVIALCGTLITLLAS